MLDLLENDNHWNDTLSEASLFASPDKMRELFAIMLVFCSISNPSALWIKYKDHFSEDLIRDIMRRIPDADLSLYKESIENSCLLLLQDFVTSVGGNPIAQYGLPNPQSTVQNISKEYLSETTYDRQQLLSTVEENERLLTDEQRNIYQLILQSVYCKSGNAFFLDAPGGTGKTFLIKLTLSKLRSEGKIALAAASSGIAATLLPGGETAHSFFKMPIDFNSSDFPVCNISKNSAKAELIRNADLIVWDECTMALKKSVEALDRTLRDLCNDSRFQTNIARSYARYQSW